MVVLHRFFDAGGEGFHVASGHAAVGVQTFIDDREVAGIVVHVLIVDGEEAPDVDQGVFLGAHGAAVGLVAHLAQDGGDGAVAVAGLALLNEVGVLDSAGGIEDDADSVL